MNNNIIKKHWGAIAIEMTEKSEAKIKELVMQQTDIQVMNIIGEGTPRKLILITCRSFHN